MSDCGLKTRTLIIDCYRDAPLFLSQSALGPLRFNFGCQVRFQKLGLVTNFSEIEKVILL